MAVSEDLVLRMRAQGARRTARDVDEVTVSIDRLDRAYKRVNKLGGLGTALTTVGPALVPALAGATAGIAGLGAAFGPATLGAGLFGAMFASTMKGVGQAASQLEAAQMKVNSTYGPQFVSQHTAAVKQLTLLNRQLTDQLGAGGPAIVAKYAAVGGAIKGFKQSFNPQVFKLLGIGLGAVQKLLPKIHPLLVATGDALIGVARSISKGIGGARFTKFMAWMTAEAPKGISAFAKIIGNLAKGFVDLFRAFVPMAGGMRNGLVNMTKAFADWASHLGTNSGFQRFLAYVRDSGPKVLSTLGKFADVFVKLGPTLAAAGASSLILLNGVAGVLGALEKIPFVGPAFGALLGPLVVASKLGPGIKGLSAALAFLAANPIFLVLAGLTAVGVELYTLYQRNATFRDNVNGAWADIKKVTGGAINWLIDRLNTFLARLNDTSDAIKTLTLGAVDFGHFGVVDHVDKHPALQATKRPTGVIGPGDAGPAIGVTKPIGAPYVGAGDAGPAVGTVKALGRYVPTQYGDTVVHNHIHLNDKEIARSVVRVGHQSKASR